MVTRNNYVADIATFFPPQGRWTEADFFALPEVMRIVELANGELIVNAAALPLHQLVITELLDCALQILVREQKLGIVLTANTALRLWEGNIREPDILFIRAEHTDWIGKRYVEGADWVCEVISRGTKKVDEVDKLRDYAKAGIPEYWLIDPKKRTIRVYALRGGEAYILAGTYAAGETASSETIKGFQVSVDQVFTSI